MSCPQKFAESVLLSAHELLPVGCPGRSPRPALPNPPLPGADPPCLFSACHSSPLCIPHLSPPSILAAQSLTPCPPPFSGALAVLPGLPAVSIFWLLQTTLTSALSGRLLASCPLPHTWVLRISLQLPKCLFPLSSGAVDIFRAEKAFQSPERSTACTEIHAHAQTHSHTYTYILIYMYAQT